MDRVKVETAGGLLTSKSAKLLRGLGLTSIASCGNPYHNGLRKFIARPRKGWIVRLGDIEEPEITGDGYRKWSATFQSGWSETFFEPSTLGVTLPRDKFELIKQKEVG